MESRFVSVANLSPSPGAEDILEPGKDFSGSSFRLPIHSPDDRLPTGGVAKGLPEDEVRSGDESEGFGGHKEFAGKS